MATFLEWFAIGTLGFWIALFVLSVIILASAEYESFGFSGFSVLVFLSLIWRSLPDLGAVVWLSGLAGYFLVGGIWSIFKWRNFIIYKGEWLAERLADIPERHDAARVETVRDEAIKDFREAYAPANQKGLIVSWIAFWPWNALWTISRESVLTIFNSLKKVYTNITEGVIADVTKQNNKNV